VTAAGDDPTGPSEEVLDSGGPPKRARTRRLREQLLLGAVILALVAAVGRAMSGDDKKPDAAPTPTPSATGSHGAPDPGSGLLNGSVVNPSGRPDDPADCPVTYQCLQTDEAGEPAVRALVAAFPDALLMSATTIRLLSPNFGQPLWFRQINARFGPNRILIRVQQGRPSDVDRRGVAHAEDSEITFYEAALAKYHVAVQVSAPKGHPQPLAPLQKLARDVRLLGLS
jgi:hypothetical protein